MKSGKELARGTELRKTALFVAVFFSCFFYITWRLLFTLPLHHGLFSMIWGVLLWVAESGSIIENYSHFYNVRRVKIPEMPEIPDSMYPDVDVMICTHNESEELLFKTVNGCKYMKYPDKSKVHIYLCDDRDRPGVRQLAERMGVGYFGFTGNKHAKAGNLNYALPKTDSPLVAIFDADMIPTSAFLTETVPYFFLREMIKDNGEWRRRTPEEPCADKPLGYVQTPQSFYNPDPLQRNLYMEKTVPNEQDHFYRSVNVARTNTGSAVFAGSNSVFSRKALEDAGGLASYSITEDLATSLAVLDKGYGSLAVDKELAHGLSPEDAFSFIKQRQRWSRGAAQVIPTMRFLRSKLPLKTKWSFVISYLYWWTFVRRAIFILSPILYALLGISVASVSLKALAAVWLPFYIIYNTGVRVMSGGTTSALWSAIADTIQFPYLIWPIIAGTLKIPEQKFWVTPKEKTMGRNSSLKLAIPHMVLVVLSLIAVGVCIRDIFVVRYEGAIIVLFWLCYNLFSLLNAVVYYYGRVNNRNHERIAAPVPVTMQPDRRKLEGVTMDLSEGGMAVLMQFPEYLPYDRGFLLTAVYNEYRANMQVQVRQVQEREKQWKYGLMIVDIDEREKGEYLQILYDRDHAFSRTIEINITKEAWILLRGLTAKPLLGERRLPRIKMHAVLPTSEAGAVEVIDFNYKYAMLRDDTDLPDRLTLSFSSTIRVACVKDNTVSVDRLISCSLYQVENWEELAADPAFRECVFGLVNAPRTAGEAQPLLREPL